MLVLRLVCVLEIMGVLAVEVRFERWVLFGYGNRGGYFRCVLIGWKMGELENELY